MSIEIWLISSLIILSVLEIIKLVLSYRNDEPFSSYLLLTISFAVLGFLFPLLNFFSYQTFLSNLNALIIWKLSFIIEIIFCSLSNLINCLILKSKKSKFISIISMIFLGGLNVSNLWDPNSVYNIIIRDEYYYYFSFYTTFLLFIYHIVFACFIYYYQFKLLFRTKNRKESILLSMSSFFLVLAIIFYLISGLANNGIFFIVALIFIITAKIISIIVFFKKPNLFIHLSNRLKYLTIFHKSGILLFSYNFETKEEIEESFLKGSILIGINHVLNSFEDKKNLLDYIKIKDKFAYFDFDKQYGYAILLIANQSNKLIKNSIGKFMNVFTQRNMQYLEEINQNMALIDISKFQDTHELIMEVFQIFLSNNHI